MVKPENAKNKIIKLLGIRTIIVIVPLLVIVVFSFSYMSLESLNLQRTLAGKKINPRSNDSNLSTLPLVTAPDLPKLSQDISTATDISDNTKPNTPTSLDSNSNNGHSYTSHDKSGAGSNVGPSSKDAGDILQSVNNSKNDELQATRQAVQLDKLVP